MLLTLTLSLTIGLLLGLLGGGGSILTVPMLVYLLHVEPKTAITTSFVVVGLSSLLALLPHAKRHSVCWQSGLFFGLSGMVGAFVGGRLAAFFTSDLLMGLFGIISLITGLLMLRRPKRSSHTSPSKPMRVCPVQVPYLRVLFDGFFVGGLTGLVGVGGGFLIVPALTLLVGLPMQGAIGTSLMIIVMNAAAGLAGYIQHAELDLPLILQVAVGALVGSALGAMLSGFVKPAWLRRGFGALVVAIGLFVLSQAFNAQLLSDAAAWLSTEHSKLWLGLALASLLILVSIGNWVHKADTIVFKTEHTLDEQ